MHHPTAYDLLLRLALLYGLIGVFAAFTVAVGLSLLGRISVPARARKPVYGLYVLSAIALGGAFVGGALHGPSEAAVELAAAAESARAFNERDNNVLAADDPRASSTQVGTVYIQVPDMDARFAADELWRALTAAGFRSPGIELVSGRSPSTPEVRYFNDGDRPVADRVAAIAAEHGLKGAVVKTIANYKAPPGQIEFWYPR